MAVSLEDGIWSAPLPETDRPNIPPELQVAQLQEQADEDAVFVATNRARVASEQARALRDGVDEAGATGGLGFAQSFVTQSRARAQDAVERAFAPDAAEPRPGQDAVAAFLSRAGQDTDRLIDRVARVETTARAEKRKRGALEALDAIRQGVENDPDDFEAALLRQQDVLDVLGPVLAPDAMEGLRSDQPRTLAETAIRARLVKDPLGTITELEDTNRFPQLPPDRREELIGAAQRRAIAQERDAEATRRREAGKAALDHAVGERRFSSDYLTKVRQGEAGDAEIEDAVDRGVILPTTAVRLRQARDIETRREDDRQERISRVRSRIDQGVPLSSADPDDMQAVDDYWRSVGLPAFNAVRPENRAEFITEFFADTGVVPAGMVTSFRAMWDSGVPEMRIGAARTLDQLRQIPNSGADSSVDEKFQTLAATAATSTDGTEASAQSLGGVERGATSSANADPSQQAFTGGTLRRGAGQIDRSFESNRADASRQADGGSGPGGELLPNILDDTNERPSVTPRSLGDQAGETVGQLDANTTEGREAQNRLDAKRRETLKKLEKPFADAPIKREAGLTEGRLDGRDIFDATSPDNNIGGRGVTKEMRTRLGDDTLRPILKRLLIYDKLTILEKQEFNSQIVIKQGLGKINNKDVEVFNDIKDRVINKTPRSMKLLSRDELAALQSRLLAGGTGGKIMSAMGTGGTFINEAKNVPKIVPKILNVLGPPTAVAGMVISAAEKGAVHVKAEIERRSKEKKKRSGK